LFFFFFFFFLFLLCFFAQTNSQDTNYVVLVENAK
jgi:hypothetical protein